MTLALPRLNRVPAAQRGITIGDFLVPIRVGESLSVRARHLVLVIAGALVVAVTAQVYIPTVPVPFTGQTFGVLVVGGALGFRRAAASLALYVALGAIGLPIYSEGRGGLDVLTGVTGGYIIGFIVAAALVGKLAELGWDRHIGGSLGAMLLGSAVIYAFGVPWLAAVTGMSASEAVAAGMTPFLVWDAIKLVAAAGIFPIAWWIVARRPNER
jgi:biotin transport system substrate-specific component